VEVDVNQGQVQPLPIAVPPFSGADARTSKIGGEVAQVIAADLERSGFFRPLDAASFPEHNSDVAVQPNFTAWRGANAQALVNGAVTLDADGRLRVSFRLWDVFNQQQLVGREFTSTPDNWRRVAHKVADAVYQRLTGETPYFDTRIAFVAESGTRGHRTKRLAVMDQDGANPTYVVDDGSVIMTPRFSRREQEITYVSLRKDSARVYLLNLETARRETVGDFPGMVFAPRFSPDGNKLVLSVVREGNVDLYVVDLNTRQTRRLTSDPGIDTSPAFSPDGSHIVFNSDRGGSPQLYVMNTDGTGVHRISFGAGRYTTPVWSPKGDLIAATRQEGSQFHIVVMHPDGSGERNLTTSYLDEGPTWAPNGRVLMFSRETEGHGPRLWTVDVSGRNARQEPYPSGATDPAWSPLLK
jgi:TolB protein